MVFNNKSLGFTKISNFNLEKFVIDWWKNLDSCAKKSFIWMFSIINIVFLWHTVTFFFGNHDWGHVRHGVHIGWSMFDGRWGAGILQQVVAGEIFPVLNNLFCFSGFCFAMIALAKYWKLPKSTMVYTVFGLFIMLLPYTYPWLQFVRSETHFWNILIIIWGLMLADKGKLYFQFIAFVLFVFSMGCYVATIEAITGIFLGKCLLEVIFYYNNFKDFCQKHYKPILNIFISFIAYVIIYKALEYRYTQSYSTDIVNIHTFWGNILNLPHYIVTLFFYKNTYMPSLFKILLGLAFPISLFCIAKKKFSELLLILLIFIALILSSQIIHLLSVMDFSTLQRIDFFSAPYIYAAGWAILLRQKENIWKSIALFFMTIAICYSTLQAFRDQKFKYFDFQVDMKMFDDIRARIKASPNFSPDKMYRLLIIERTLEQVSYFDNFNGDTKCSWNNWVSFVPSWNARNFFNFYEIKPFITLSYNDWKELLSTSNLVSDEIDYLMNKAKPWPDANSIYIGDDIIYIVTSQKELKDFRTGLEKLGYESAKIQE